MQTWLVHTRHPLRLLRTVGWRGFLAFHLFIGGSVLSALLNPILWTVFLFSLVFGWRTVGIDIGQTPLLFSAGSLVAGHLILTGIAVINPVRRGWPRLAPYGFMMIFYWMLISLAAYRALHQLIVNPHYWDKTEHGVQPRRRP